MTAEAPTTTVRKFSKSWNNLNKDQLKAEFESIHSETNRKPDVYYFKVQDNKLIDPNTNKPVEEFVERGVEFTVFLKLQEWAASKDSGIGIWISPPLDGVYPCAKVIISRIAYDSKSNKNVLNSAITMDLTEEIHNPNFKRGTLYTTEDDETNIFKILRWIERKTNQEVIITGSRNHEQTEYYTNLLNNGYSTEYVITEMQRSGYIGQSSISCPPSINVLFFAGQDRYGSLEFECPSCKRKNTRPFGQLIPNCLHCGADVGC